jgi:putative membrane protein
MRTRIIISILLAILLVVFTIQNSEIITVRLYFWDTNIPGALLFLICLCIGVFIGILIPVKKKHSEKEEADNSAGIK